MTEVKFKRLHDFAKEPYRAYEGDAGFDLYALKTVCVPAQDKAMIETGIAIELKPYHCALVVPRSGLATKNNITVTNSPGLIDSGYRGEIVVWLTNHGRTAHWIKPGERVAQLLIVGLPSATMVEVDELSDSERGAGGFGSSG